MQIDDPIREVLDEIVAKNMHPARQHNIIGLICTDLLGQIGIILRPAAIGIPLPCLSADGVMVQDLGSANGTYINDRRVNRELLRPGDELRFDTVRFLLLAPGQQPSADRPAAGQTAATTAAASKPTASSGGRSPLLIGMIAVAVIAVVLVGLKLGGVF